MDAKLDIMLALDEEHKNFQVIVQERRESAQADGTTPEPLGPESPHLAASCLESVSQMPDIGPKNRDFLFNFIHSCMDTPAT